MRECGTNQVVGDHRFKATAAPATVSGERLPNATEHVRLGHSGRRHSAATREPGDLPFFLVACRAGCLGDGRVSRLCANRHARFAPFSHP
jgi:hypothetical protein